jgi:hypothetical protein
MHCEGEGKLVARHQIIVGFFTLETARKKGYDAVEGGEVSFIPAACKEISGPAVSLLSQK